VLNLSSVIDLRAPAREGLVLELNLNNGIEVFRFKTEADLEHWRRLLHDWREFYVTYGSLYEGPHREAPEDSGGGESADEGAGGTKRRNTSLLEKGMGLIGKAKGRRRGKGQSRSVEKDREELDSIQLDDDEEDEEKGVRPLMQVCPPCLLSFPS
jgi:hypothetical protein